MAVIKDDWETGDEFAHTDANELAAQVNENTTAIADTPGLVGDSLGARDNDGDIQFTWQGADFGDPYPIPSATWSGVSGKPTVIAGGDDATAARAAIGVGRANSGLHTFFRGKADSSVPATGDEGVAVTAGSGSGGYYRLEIVDGLLQAPDLSGASGDKGAHWQQPIDGGKRIGATFKLSTDNDDGGVVTLVFWEYMMPVPYKTPNSPFHLSVSAHSWALSVWEGGVDPGTSSTPTSIAGKDFATPLADDWNPASAGSGTLHQVEAVIIGDTATIALPDGSVATVTDSRIESIPANVADHELFRNTSSSCHSAFESIWSSTDPVPSGAASSAEAARTAKTIARAMNPLPVFAEYRPASPADITVPTTYAAITGLPTITFTLPVDATAFKVEASLYYEITSAARILVKVTSGASTYGTKTIADMTSYKGIIHYSAYHKGLTAGTGGTYTLQHRVISGSGAKLKLDAPNGYTAEWCITPIVESA